MSYHARSWESRMATLGDESEEVCKAVWPKPLAPWGLNRPPFSIARLSPFTRKAPDFVDADGYLECKGVGKDGIIKIKDVDMGVLYEYAAHDLVRLFVWDSHRSVWSVASLDDLTEALVNDGDLGTFWDGPVYTGLDVRDFPGDWVSHVA